MHMKTLPLWLPLLFMLFTLPGCNDEIAQWDEDIRLVHAYNLYNNK